MCTRVRKTRKIGEVRGGGKVLKRWMNVRWSAESSVWPERYTKRDSAIRLTSSRITFCYSWAHSLIKRLTEARFEKLKPYFYPRTTQNNDAYRGWEKERERVNCREKKPASAVLSANFARGCVYSLAFVTGFAGKRFVECRCAMVEYNEKFVINGAVRKTVKT